MDQNDFEQQYTFDRGTYYSMPHWNDFSLDDEMIAKKRFSRFFLATFIYLILSNLVGIIVEVTLMLALGERANAIFESSWYALALNTFAMYVVALPVFILLVKGMKKTIRAKERLKFSEFAKIFLVAEAFMYVGSFIGNYLNLFVGSFLGEVPSNSTSDLVMESNIWLIIAIAVIIGPIVEELIFRKLLMDKLGMYGDRIAIVVSAVTFGFFHGNLYQFFYATLLGLVLAYLYSKTANVWYPILLHMLINFMGSVIPMLLTDKIARFEEISEMVAAGTEISDELMLEYTQISTVVGGYSILVLGMFIAGLVIFFKNRRRIFVSDRCEVCIPKERRAKVIVGNAGMICFLIISLVFMFLNLFA